MTAIVRISPEEARQKTESDTAILVCAYESEEKFAKIQLAGAISYPAFKEKLSSLPLDQEIIFYCN